MEKIILSEKIIEEAKSYIPLATKEALALSLSQCCVEKVRVGMDEKMANRYPPRVQENLMTKARAVMGVFLYYYLGIEWEGWEEDLCIPLNLYDQYASSHIMNQLERMKSNGKIRDKIYDIVYDFRTFKGMLDAKIFSIVSHNNDTAMRLAAILDLSTSPEQMQAIMQNIQKISELFPKGEKE